jgi:hypothetical protein
VRLVLFVTALLFAACGPAPQPVEPPPPDPSREPWYSPTVDQLEQLNGEALAAFQKRKFDEAGQLIQKAQPLMKQLISVPRPTLAAVVAASDLDDLYGRMLLTNEHYGWARLQFQKNVARWTNWRPQTEETRLRLQQARERVAECDRQLGKDMARP